jgi:hypothetical protein
VTLGLKVKQSTWDQFVGAAGLAVVIGGSLYLRKRWYAWREARAACARVAEAERERRVAHAVAADVFHAARYPADARVDLALHAGGCHCGRVKITIRAPTALRAVDCSTSMSTKKGRFPYVFVDAADFRLDCGGDFLSVYTHGTHTAKHLFCSGCGCHVFAFPRGSAEAGSVSVNAHCLDRENVASLHVAYVPGDHLISDFEPSVPSLPADTPGGHRRSTLSESRRRGAHDSGAVSPSNPQVSATTPASSSSGSPTGHDDQRRHHRPHNHHHQQQQQPQHPHQSHQSPPPSMSPEDGRPSPAVARAELVNMTSISGITAMLAPTQSSSPGQQQPQQAIRRPEYLPLATASASAAPTPGGLGGVNFFRKSREHSTYGNDEPSLIQTLVHGGANAALAIGRAAGVLSPENRALLDAEQKRERATTYDHQQRYPNKQYRHHHTPQYAEKKPRADRSGGSQNRASGARLRYTSASYDQSYSSRGSHMSPVRAVLGTNDPLYGVHIAKRASGRGRNDAGNIIGSMNSVVSMKHLLQRHLGHHATPRRTYPRSGSAYYAEPSY